MKITYFLWGTRLVGGNRIIFEQANRLIERGHEVNIVTHSGGTPDWFPLKAKVHILPPFSESVPDSDVVVATYWPTAYEVARLKVAKKFYFIQGYEPGFYSTNDERYEIVKNTYRLPLKQVVVSRWLQEQLKNEVKVEALCIPNGIDTSVFKLQNARNKDKKELNILYVVGDYLWLKDIPSALQAFRIVKKNRSGLRDIFYQGRKRIKITFVSTQKTLYKGGEGIIDEFISNPTQPQLVDIYNKGDIFVHASIMEGFSLPPLEAMACGNAVAATDSLGIREYAKPDQNCLFLQPKQPLELANAIERLIEDDDLRLSLGSNGVLTAKEFSWDKVIDQVEKTFLSGEKE